MALKYVANESMVVSIDEIGTTATLTVKTLPSSKVKAGSPLKKVYCGDIVVEIVGAADGVCTQLPVVPPAPTPFATIKPTATKCSVEGKKVIRVDDEAVTVNVPGQDGGGNPCTVAVTVYVSDAGQTKVRAQ